MFAVLYRSLHYTRRYSPLHRLTSSSCGGLRPSNKAFSLWEWKKKLFMLLVLILGHFCCSVVTYVTFSSNLSKFEYNPKNIKNPNKNPKIQKCKKNLIKIYIQKNPTKKYLKKSWKKSKPQKTSYKYQQNKTKKKYHIFFQKS